MLLFRLIIKISIVLSIMAIFNSFHQISANQTQVNSTRLLWSCCAKIASENSDKIISVNRSTVLHAGDQIKFFFEPKSECFIYLFYHSSQGELHLLFPSDLSSTRLSAGSKYYVPSGDGWFELDEIGGIEKFFILASEKRLAKLEALYQKHAGLSKPVEIEASADSIFKEINKIKRRYRQLTTATERPVYLGGSFRNIQKENAALPFDISRLATEISFAQFYSRTLTIDHQ